MKPNTPEAVMQAFLRALNSADVAGLVDLYEADAIMLPEPGVRLSGHAALRGAFEELSSVRPALELTTTEVLEAAGLAFVTNAWTLRGVGPDARPFEKSGQSVVVLRRQADGSFRIVIDRL